MDSLTQIVLGGAVVGAIVGHKYGRKAVLAGAICGTLPDMDVFIDHGDAISNMVEHRGFSHSLLILTLFAPILTWLFSRVKWFGFVGNDKRLHVAIWLALITHPLLDTMTIYGTQLLWPISNYPFGVGSIFIIDPLYTVPLLLCLLVFLFKPKPIILCCGLMISTLYLIWSVGAQHYVTTIAKQSLDNNTYARMISLPTPLNTLLWRVLAVDKDGYRVGYYSLFDDNQEIQFQSYKSQAMLPESVDVDRLKSFTKGYYGVVTNNNDVLMQDLRMGLEPNDYVFQYIVGQQNGRDLNVVPPVQYRAPRDTTKRLGLIWNRIWDEDARVY